MLQLAGQRFGNLTAIRIVDTYKTKKVWECLCDCGEICTVVSSKLKNGEIQSCGCLRSVTGDLKKTYRGFGELSGYIWSRIKHSALQRGWSFNISIEYAWELYIKQDKKCALTNVPLQMCDSRKLLDRVNNTASLDRIDSKIGYEEGNIWWVHKDVNKMKQTFDREDFIKMCGEVYLNNKNKIQPINIPSWEEYFLNIAKEVSKRSTGRGLDRGR